MSKQLTFKAFELQLREHSPNAVLGITDDGKRMFITAPASALGKELGDKIAIAIKEALERAFIKTVLLAVEPTMIECLHCQELQTHGFPMSGKLYCRSCGELLDEIIA